MVQFPHIRVSPLTRKRLLQFRRNRRAWWSLLLLATLYALSLAAPLICRYKPGEVMSPASFEVYSRTVLTLLPEVSSGRLNLTMEGRISRPEGCEPFFPGVSALAGEALSNHWAITPELQAAIHRRFANEASPAFSAVLTHRARPASTATFSLTAYEPRETPPASIRLALRSAGAAAGGWTFTAARRKHRLAVTPLQAWNELPPETRAILQTALTAPAGQVGWETNLVVRGAAMHARASPGDVTWPFRPVPGHWMGIDGSGRDVFSRVAYGLRTALTFGLLLVGWAMLLGFVIGSAQGYFGGWLDIVAQRLVEIWSALPFLYVMILVGSVLGRSFLLLLVCYGLFNWIGLSYYMRAEFLRLRHRPFVEAARCQGLGHLRIIFRHLLPNALTPIITLFPFELVGAVAALTALDFLGFGLPPLTPSLGELLQQAEQYRWAWWLVAFPTGTLFVVMFLAVMVGEGLRDAFDPKPSVRLEG